METKTKQATDLFHSGEYKKALRIFKTFKIGFTKDEKRSIEIAHEYLTGKGSFYSSLGIDVENELKKAKEVISKKYPK